MRRALPYALLALALLAWFGTLGFRDLIHPDEGRYAELSRQMLASGDWLTPRLNGLLYFEKPPLQYWASAASFAVFGHGEFAARLWPGLAGALAVLALWWCARRILGPTVALYAACVLGSCVWWLGNSHFINLDTTLSACLAGALLGFWVAQRDDATRAEARVGMALAWLAMGLAVLAKGLVGIVLPAGALVAYMLWQRDPAPLRRLNWSAGPLIFVLVAAPWFVAASLANPDFAHFFFIEQHFHRYLTHTHRPGPWWYFVPVLLVGLLPWTTLLPGALRVGWQRVPGRFQGNRLLLAWCVAIFVFFSASGSKLPSYILPIFPALALLVAQHLVRLSPGRLASHAVAIAAIAILGGAGLAGMVAGWLGAPRAFSPQELRYRDWILAGLAIIAVFAIVAALLARRGRATAAVVALAFSGLVGTQVVLLGHQSFAAQKSARQLVAKLAPALPPGAPVFSVSHYDQTLPFYLGRPVMLVNWVDEFAIGQRLEPDRSLRTEAEFAGLWRSLPAAGAVMKPDTWARWRDAGLPMRVVYEDGARVAVVKTAP
jgi:4-amino-4-deoxy-L-arabinose transferase-like glycosyltransferase